MSSFENIAMGNPPPIIGFFGGVPPINIFKTNDPIDTKFILSNLDLLQGSKNFFHDHQNILRWQNILRSLIFLQKRQFFSIFEVFLGMWWSMLIFFTTTYPIDTKMFLGHLYLTCSSEKKFGPPGIFYACRIFYEAAYFGRK